MARHEMGNGRRTGEVLGSFGATIGGGIGANEVAHVIWSSAYGTQHTLTDQVQALNEQNAAWLRTQVNLENSLEPQAAQGITAAEKPVAAKVLSLGGEIAKNNTTISNLQREMPHPPTALMVDSIGSGLGLGAAIITIAYFRKRSREKRRGTH